MPQAQFNSTAFIVDDTDPTIVYSSGWLRSTTSAEYNGTKTGANEAGMTATFVFNGVFQMFIRRSCTVLNYARDACRHWH